MSEAKVATLNKYQVNKSLRSKIKKSIPKPVLCAPYKIIWPNVDAKVQEQILSDLTKLFYENNFKTTPIDNSSLKGLNKKEKKYKRIEHRQAAKKSRSYKLRECLAIGINEVTRLVEGNIREVGMMAGGEEGEGPGSYQQRDELQNTITNDDNNYNGGNYTNDAKNQMKSNECMNVDFLKTGTENGQILCKTKNFQNQGLSLLLVDRSSPWQLHRHLIQMAAICKCPAVAIDNLSERISPLLSLTRLCAFGFKRSYKDILQNEKDVEFKKCTESKNQIEISESDHILFETVINTISSLCPVIELPWMECENYLINVKNTKNDIEKNKKEIEENDDDDVDDEDGDMEIEEKTNDVRMKEEALSFKDLYIFKGVNEHEFEELLSLRKKSPFVEKNFELMMFNYDPKQPSISTAPIDMVSVFYSKKPDRRIKKFKDGENELGNDEDDQNISSKLKGFVSIDNNLSNENNLNLTENCKRKRKFTDKVVKKVQKNEYKKKRKCELKVT